MLAVCECLARLFSLCHAAQASTDFAPRLDYRLRHVGGVPVLEEHSSSAEADAAAAAAPGQQAGGAMEVSPVLPAERLATQCHQDAILALASVEVRLRGSCLAAIGTPTCDPIPSPSNPQLDPDPDPKPDHAPLYKRASELSCAAAQVSERMLLSCSQDGIIKAWK